MPKKYNTPKRNIVVKTRMTDEEYADFTERVNLCGVSQSEFIRQAIDDAVIKPIITVSPVNEKLLLAVGQLTAQLGKVGGTLNIFFQTISLIRRTNASNALRRLELTMVKGVCHKSSQE